MYQLNECVSALFNKTKNCTLSTNGEYPNTFVIMFKEINAQGEILLCDVFHEQDPRQPGKGRPCFGGCL